LNFWKIKKRTGIDAFCAHAGRHTWATRYRRVGTGDLFDLKEKAAGATCGWSSDTPMVVRAKNVAERPVRSPDSSTAVAGSIRPAWKGFVCTRPEHKLRRSCWGGRIRTSDWLIQSQPRKILESSLAAR